METKLISKIEGLVAAPFTAMNSDGSLNLNKVEQQAAHLIATGVRGAFICGTTGEGPSLTIDERKALAERWMNVAGRDLKIIVHTGHNCVADSKTLAAHAQSIGAHATAAIAPSFFKPANVTDLVDLCVDIAQSSPGLPFYYYHIPVLTGVNFPMAALVAQARDRIPNFAGVKFTHENLMDFSQCIQSDNGRFDMLFGRDEILLSALVVGARGAVGSTYNYSAAIHGRVMNAFFEGNLAQAQKEQAYAVQTIDWLVRFGGLPAGKAIMHMIGIDCGPVRLPLKSLSQKSYNELREGLEKIGFFQAIKVNH